MIALHLPASEPGFKQAELKARKLGSQLALNEFDWEMYLDPEKLPGGKLVSVLVHEFKEHYMATHSLSEHSWKNEQHKIFSRLPQDQPLTNEILMERVVATKQDTRNRRVTCAILQQLADFAGLKVNLLKYRGNYSSARPQGRKLPPDAMIKECRQLITNPGWLWVYGILATYGLRPHEAWFCHFTEDGLQVTRGKTGPRLVYAPLFPEWVEEWGLREITLPNIDGESKYEKLGSKVNRAFRSYKVPFQAYSLRHAYAIRASVTFRLNVTTAADLMGHSPAIHLKTYHRHIDLRQNMEAVEGVLRQSNRPKPP